MSVRKVGGIWFWRVGRVGGSLHLKKSAPVAPKPYRGSYWAADALLVLFTLTVTGGLFF